MPEKHIVEGKPGREISEHGPRSACGPEPSNSPGANAGSTSLSVRSASSITDVRHRRNGGRMQRIHGSVKVLETRIPGLKGRTVKVHAEVPRLVARQSELTFAPRLSKPEPDKPARPVPEVQGPPNIRETPRPIAVTVIPPPKKRQPRLPKQEVTAPPVPVALKVIRRRREQAPKVFEKTVKSFPKGMLEGVELHSEEIEENHPEQGE